MRLINPAPGQFNAFAAREERPASSLASRDRTPSMQGAD